jgi:hypothetical protein
MGRGILEGTPRTEQVELEQRTSDPSNPDAQEAWLRVDIKPTYEDADGTQQTGVAEYRIANGDGGVDTAPVAQLGHATGQDVIDKRRVFVDAGGSPTGVGFIPYATASSGLASYPKRRLEHPTDGRLQMHDALYRAIPDSVVNQYPTDTGSGSTLQDAEGAEDGTINGPTWQSLADAVGGFYLSYDGVDDTTDFADSAFDYTTQAAMTVTAFINPDDTSSIRAIATKDGGDGGEGGTDVRGWLFRLFSSDVLQWVHPAVEAVGSLSVPVNQWSFVAARYDPGAGEVTLTVNDTQETVAINPQQNDASGEAARFGTTSLGGDYFAGSMDEITVSNDTLTDSELGTLRDRRDDV